MKKSLPYRICAMIFVLIFSMSTVTLAHSGRTDSSGGHKDNKNASGLGSYHYHHGSSAHLHTNGVCPYDFPTPTPSPTSKPAPATTAAPAPAVVPATTTGQLIVHYLDVGQADSILIQLPTDEIMLIDFGNNDDGKMIADYLKAANISKINYLVATHPHEDHIGGMDDVINAFDIGKIYMPKALHTTKTFEDVLKAIEAKSLKISTATTGANLFDHPGLSASFIAPNSDEYTDLNDYSAVIRLVYGETSFLFTGDAETISEDEMVTKKYNVKADVLKVGHHGGDTSTTEAFLAAVNPAYAIISCGADNSYGHPTQAVLDRLANVKAAVYRTDMHGTIIVRSDGKNIAIGTGKE